MRPTLTAANSPLSLPSFLTLLLRCRSLLCLPQKNSYKPYFPASAPNSHVTPLPRRFSVSASAMDRCVLVLCGKSPEEKGLASSLKSKKALKLMDRETGDDIDTAVLVDGETEVESFGVGSYMDGLETQHFGRFLVWTPKITSTHDLLHQNFGELPVGTACLADAQSKGRGRVSNVWESPAGCLMYSFTVQMHNGRILPLLQYVVSLAVTEAVKHVCQEKGFPHLDVKIKWPNDIYLNGLKVAGISCNSKYKSGIFNVSSGVGLNLDNAKPTTCLNAVLQELTSTKHKIKREEILSAFFNKFEDYFETFLTQGFVVLEDLYYQTWLHSGQIVTISEKREGEPTEETCVTIQGLTTCGYLLGTDDHGNNYELSPDGNSFDFFEGLVRRKLS